ncbi:alpha/beta fold hydrolase [Streptomyces sp. NPDC001586]|uniref:alpha/beta fold hydrolase n=1 Tax=Streptomyces sp. NPDC001586 TaxID=3154387 RepID=UPI00332F57EE
MCSTFHHHGENGDRVPIGRPIANTEAYVMDRYGCLAPLGVPGELWIGGSGVARGYWNRPELTEEKFVPHPFKDGPDARLYRTGDLVRWLPDGNLEFLGRIDQQVKLRGLRIELGEIETVLASHDQITAVVVLVREDTPGDKRLVAYLVPAPGSDPDTPALREWCKQALPDYMIPGWFVTLPALPLTPNGKVDRKALPEPAGDRPDLGDTYTAPRNDIETAIADIWSDILGIDNIGIHDNFFDLGGHSLRAVTVATRLKAAGMDVSVRQVMQHRSIAAIASAVAESIRPSVSTLTLELAPQASAQGVEHILFCIHPSGGSAHWYEGLAQQLADSCQTYGIQAAGLDPSEVPYRVMEEMADRYWEEMKGIQPQGPYHVLGWSLGGLIAHEIGRRHPDEVAAVYLLEPPTVQPGVQRQMLSYAAKYRAAAEMWLEGRAAEGTERDDIESRFRSFVASLEFMTESPGLRDWLPFEALGGIMEAAARYEPDVSRAKAILVVGDETKAISDGSLQGDGSFDQYLSYWRSLYSEGVRVVEISGSHIEMMTSDPSLAEVTREIRSSFPSR